MLLFKVRKASPLERLMKYGLSFLSYSYLALCYSKLILKVIFKAPNHEVIVNKIILQINTIVVSLILNKCPIHVLLKYYNIYFFVMQSHIYFDM